MWNVLKDLFDAERLAAPLSVAICLLAGGLVFAWWKRKTLPVWLSRHELVHAGGESTYYFDADDFLGDPSNIGKIGLWFSRVLQEEQQTYGKVDRLAFIEKAEGPVGALTLKDFLSWHTNIAAVTVRLRLDVPCAKLKIKGKPARGVSGVDVLRSGEHVVLVTDVLTTGETVRSAVCTVHEAGGQVRLIVGLFDREEGASRELNKISEAIRTLVYLKLSDLPPLTKNGAGLKPVSVG